MKKNPDKSHDDKKKKRKKRKGKNKGSDDEQEEEEEVKGNGTSNIQVYTGQGEMPDGVEDSGDDGKSEGDIDADDPHRALDINLDE